MEGAGCPTPKHTSQQLGQSEEWQLEGSQLTLHSTVLNSHKNLFAPETFVIALCRLVLAESCRHIFQLDVCFMLAANYSVACLLKLMFCVKCAF